MINKKTVFILGAGASHHLGYPLGKDLWRKVVEYLAPIKDFGKISKEDSIKEKNRVKNRNLLTGVGIFSEKDINEFYHSLSEYGPKSIDEFLENNPQYNKLGRFTIAQVLIPYEDDSILTEQQDWYQYLFECMKEPIIKFHENNITFITYNYDRSLEQYLFKKLQYSQVSKRDECIVAIKKLNFIHVYGKLGDLPWENPEGRAYTTTCNSEELLKAASRIVMPREQQEKLKSFDDVFKSAERILFLGFGFDKFNFEKLGLLPWVDGTKLITGTALNLTRDKKREIKAYFMQKKYKIILREMKILDFLHDVNLS